jgi:hypothetical protein
MSRWRCWGALAVVLAAGPVLGGCSSVKGGPERLYAVAEETTLIRDQLRRIDLAEFSALAEAGRMRYRNDWIAARMYAIDIQYTSYEAALTQERQNVGFGAAATTLGLTAASGLVAPVATKDLLTALAGFVTGARAAYDDNILLAHSMQWVQSQMRTQRTLVAERIFRGLKRSTADYSLAQALSDLEDYYRAGTFTGGLIATSETLGAEAKNAAEVRFGANASTEALQDCLRKPGARNALLNLMSPRSSLALGRLTVDTSAEAEAARTELLNKARAAGVC